METKVCSDCGETKPLEAFPTVKKNKPWRRKFCRPCKEKRMHGYYVSARDRRAAASRRFFASHPDYLRDWNLRKTYGITLADVEAMVGSQGGMCAICTSPINARTCHVDHSHATGGIRGALCRLCNSLLGFAREDRAVLARAISYLDRA